MRSITAAAVALLAASACTHHRPAAAPPRRVHGTWAPIELRDGTRLRAYAAPGLEGGLVWRTARGVEIDRRRVATVTVQDHGRGALEGLGIGVGLGVAAGIVVGLSAEDDPPCTGGLYCIGFSAAEKGTMTGVVLAGILGLFGAAAGGAAGSSMVYELTPPARALRWSAAPLPGGAAAGLGFSF
jgi:hypothetical protein